ncbi:F-box/WD repeat-containing protein 5-like [Pecten maximus]|uniref:F-box/WD repeat-containing protein 5-like n=1 Tax=Pecten maximus TaxID=6579 RepID=UPI0014589208|nr:F-box/WD repeat-containing protein 5-like [Pecten maximus]
MPLHCIGERRSPSEIDNDEETCPSIWQKSPDSILLDIFSSLKACDLLQAAQTCKDWHRVCQDESLWKGLMQNQWGVKTVCLPPGKESWQAEYRRLHYLAPMHLSETLTDHHDEVLHVSFSHRGDMFSTTSKDATIKVWSVGYPTTIKYSKDFRKLLSWDFTQFSCFNQSDSMLLVSSVKTRDFIDRRGFVAILSILHDFHILRVVAMDPSQLFGAWLDDSTFLGGCLEISLDRFATTVQIESFEVQPSQLAELLSEGCSDMCVEEGGGNSLFTFCSETASLIKFLTVANVPVNPIEPDDLSDLYSDSDSDMEAEGLDDRSVDENMEDNFGEEAEAGCSSSYSGAAGVPDSCSVDYSKCGSACGSSAKDQTATTQNMIFVTGEFAVALHQVGFKNLSPPISNDNTKTRPHRDSDLSSNSDLDELGCEASQEESHMVVNFSNNDIQLRRIRKSDKPDHLIDLYGHVTGLCLSSDHRYLFLNCRPWIGTVDRTDPWATPDLSPSIEVRVIDLCTLKDTKLRYTGHKGFSPCTMCCFVFLDVSEDYVGSGSEDAKGYIWDRHYTTLLSTYQHGEGVVNAIAFCPNNQEYLVTVSDDNTIKIWRSKHLMRGLEV